MYQLCLVPFDRIGPFDSNGVFKNKVILWLQKLNYVLFEISKKSVKNMNFLCSFIIS